jgi:hypothetical protein
VKITFDYWIAFIDAHMEGGRGGLEGCTSCTPSIDFEKLYHKNAIKHENRGPPSQIFSQPPQKKLKMTEGSQSMIALLIQSIPGTFAVISILISKPTIEHCAGETNLNLTTLLPLSTPILNATGASLF